jgi:hypothetical protein
MSQPDDGNRGVLIERPESVVIVVCAMFAIAAVRWLFSSDSVSECLLHAVGVSLLLLPTFVAWTLSDFRRPLVNRQRTQHLVATAKRVGVATDDHPSWWAEVRSLVQLPDWVLPVGTGLAATSVVAMLVDPPGPWGSFFSRPGGDEVLSAAQFAGGSVLNLLLAGTCVVVAEARHAREYAFLSSFGEVLEGTTARDVPAQGTDENAPDELRAVLQKLTSEMAEGEKRAVRRDWMIAGLSFLAGVAATKWLG